MDLLMWILVAVVVLGGLNIFMLLRKQQDPQQLERLAVIMKRLDQLGDENAILRDAMDKKLGEVQRSGSEQFREANRIIGEISKTSERLIANVTDKLSALDKTNQRIVDFSSQLQSIQDILKNPKQRGVLGEHFLEEILANVLPPGTFKMQYPFADGTIVDAAVLLKNGDKVIPVDAKFSLENYERLVNAAPEERPALGKQFKQDLKQRINETAKYIKPEEDTTDFAFMFIPSETIYYDLLVGSVGGVDVNRQNLIEYAFRDKRVVIVSPTSFLAYLQTVLQGLKALAIEENAKHIRSRVHDLGKHLGAFDTYMAKLGKTLDTTVGHYNNAYKEFGKIDKDVMRITERDDRMIAPEQINKTDTNETE